MGDKSKGLTHECGSSTNQCNEVRQESVYRQNKEIRDSLLELKQTKKQKIPGLTMLNDSVPNSSHIKQSVYKPLCHNENMSACLQRC